MNIENGTTLTFLGLSFLLLEIILIFFLSRKYITIPIFAAACYMTLGQKIIIFGLDFTLIRIILLICWGRLLIKKELFLLRFNLNIIDKLFLWWVIASITIYTIQYGTTNAFINRIGFAFNSIGMYFLFRYLIKDLADINRMFKQLAIIIFPLAMLMLFESFTGKNVFSILGGVPEISPTRNGIVRCFGPFRSPHLSGTLGATLIPFFISMWFNPKFKKLFSLIGGIAATIITITSASSGPIMTFGIALIGMLIYPIRANIRMIKWLVMIMLIILHLTMKAPIWYLIMRLGNVIGGAGWHRSYLIDQFFKNFGEWWLIGASDISHWMPYGHPTETNMVDITNQYIGQGVNGGLITLLLFISIIIFCFKRLGKVIKETNMQTLSVKIVLWCLGVALFAHVINFISVAYFDQIILFWYFLLAMISSINMVYEKGINQKKCSIC